jgi:predicted nucleotidyltransferase
VDRSEALASARRFAEAVRREMQPMAIVLIGSHAKGCARDDSDIDIAVVFNGYEGNKWEAATRLWLLIAQVDDRIEPVLLDIADDPGDFLEEVFRTGEVLYSAG